MSADLSTQPPPSIQQPTLGAWGWVRWVWRQLTSMRTALQLLLLLAVAAIPGSVFPQRRVDAGAVQSYLLDHRESGPWLDRIGAFDVYASPWFSAIYLLLFVSLVGCVVPRTRVHWRALRAAPPRTPSRLERMPEHTRVSLDGADADAVLVAARTALRRRRYRVAAHGPDGEPDSWAGEKGYSSETGNLVFHVALLFLLVAVAFGALFSYAGQVVVVTGRGFANTLPRYDSFSAGIRVGEDDLPPFGFDLDDLDVRFEDDPASPEFGAPRQFTASVTVRDTPDGPARRDTIAVNHPLNVDGARVFLVGNGYAPVVTVRDGEGNVVYSAAKPFRAIDGNYTSDGVVKVPDARPAQLGFIGQLLPTAVLRNGRPVSVFPGPEAPQLLLTGYTGELYPDGRAQSVYVLNTDEMTQLTADGEPWRAAMAPGDTVTLPGGNGTVTFEGVRRYAALDIRADPTKKYVLAAAVLGLGGLISSLFVRRRRIWVRVRRRDDGGLDVEAAGLSRREDAGLAQELAEIVAEVTRTPGRPPVELSEPPPSVGAGTRATARNEE